MKIMRKIKVLIVMIIFIIIFSISCKVYAAPAEGYWKNAWDSLNALDLATDMNYWPDGYTDAIGNALSMSDDDLKNLNNNQWDRTAFLKLLEKYLDDNSMKADFEGSRNAIIEIQDRVKNLESYYEEQGIPFTNEEKEILGIPIVDEEGNEQPSDIITSGEAAENTNRINEINSILESGIENGEVISDERRQELEEERDRLLEDNNERADEVNNKSEHTILDRKPIGILPEDTGDGEITVDETIDGAMDFVNSGDDIIAQDRLQETIGSLYNVLLVIAMVVAVVTGLIIAIRFMTSSVEGKAEVKKTLVPYVISCAVTFGAFGIWKLVVEILNNLE